MSVIYLKRKKAGQIEFIDGLVDITDPGYDKDVWCRTDDVPIKPGKYNCYAYTSVDDDNDERCFICSIVHHSYNVKCIPKRGWKKICSIGVDAGMAGFFSHKPDFDDNQWSALCERIGNKHVMVIHDVCEGFFTSSGYGDGSYEVFAYDPNDEIVALEIRF